MAEQFKIDSIILTTTFREEINEVIDFVKSLCQECLRIKNQFIVIPVLVFEKSENYKYKKVKRFFENKYVSFRPLILLNKSGREFASSLNYGINKTDSKWIIRIDTDDTLKEIRILEQLNLMQKEDLDLSSGYMEDQNGNILRYPKDDLSLKTKLALGMNPIAHPSVCIKRESLTTLYDSTLPRCEDFELWLNFILKRDFKWKCIQYPITIYNTERSKIKDKENGKMQIKIRLKYGFKLLIIALVLLIGIVPNFIRICLSNNYLLNIRRKLN